MGETVNEDLVIGVQLVSIDRIIFLRDQMQQAIARLDANHPSAARYVLEQALAATDVGKMKVWEAGEEPFPLYPLDPPLTE